MIRWVVLLQVAVEVAGHGYMFEPKSRQREANEAGEDYCP